MKFFVFLLALSTILLAQDKLKEEEIKDSPKVQFKNKSTKRAQAETKFLHETIGKKLGKFILAQPNNEHEVDGVRVRRVVTNEENKLGGDILYLGESTEFGHIHSIQRILSGYIQTVFEYPENQAEILAVYTLYYNAINRGNLDYILSKYTSKVKSFITKNGLGISTNYRDWAGKTEILIPLERNILKKFTKDVKLDELEESVNKKDISTKTFEEDKKKFEDFKKEKLSDEKKIIESKKENLVKLDEVLDDKYKKIEEKLKDLKKDSNSSDEVKDLSKEKEILEKRKEAIKKEKEELIAREERISELEKTTQERDKSKDVKVETTEKDLSSNVSSNTDSKKEEPSSKTSEESSDIAFIPVKKEEKEVPKKEDTTQTKNTEKLEAELKEVKKELEAKKEEEKKKIEFSSNVLDGKIFFIKPVTYIEGQCNNELHALDPNKDDFVFKSEYNQICGRIFKEFGGHILVVGFKEHKDQIRLVLLSRSDLKPIAFSDTDVYQKTILDVQQNFLYAVEVENGKHYLAKYDKTLKRILRTDQEIFPDANITFFGKKVYISGKNEGGKVEFKIFNKEDLKFLKKVQT